MSMKSLFLVLGALTLLALSSAGCDSTNQVNPNPTPTTPSPSPTATSTPAPAPSGSWGSPPQTTSSLADLTLTKRSVFGQINLQQGNANRIVPNAGFHVAGVQVDTTKTPNAIYVADSGNSRVLGFRSFGNCSLSQALCTVDADCPSQQTCVNNPARDADIVFGQPSLYDYGACNLDVEGGNLPGAETLCFITSLLQGKSIITTAEDWSPIVMATDGSGDLYIPDLYNSRVLEYDDPFNNGTTATTIYGQTATNGWRCNQGGSSPTASTLCFDPVDHTGAGATVDSSGNLWIADSGNGRVLRFAPGSTQADLVLGQPNFTTGGENCGTTTPNNQMCRPVDVKVSSSGVVYVSDSYDTQPSRVLYFKPPLSNGMSASVVIPTGTSYGNYLAIDPSGEGALWVTNGTGAALYGSNGNLTSYPSIQFSGGGFGGGGVGTDAAGNLYFAPDIQEPPGSAVARFSTPTGPSGGASLSLGNANGTLMTNTWNQESDQTVQDNDGMVVIGNQLFVADSSNNRILVFNDYKTAASYAHADYIMGCNAPDSCAGGFFGGGISTISTDKAGRLWVAGNGSIYAFNTPIVQGGTNLAPALQLNSGSSVLWADDSTPVNFNTQSVAYDTVNDILWEGGFWNPQLYRIRHPFNSPVVDMSIGQNSKTSQCNLGQSSPAANTICGVTVVALDNYGNLYAVDGSYEGNSNQRILEYPSSEILASYSSLFPLINASLNFPDKPFTQQGGCISSGEPCSPVYVAFDSWNRMYVGTDAYSSASNEKLWVYQSPLTKQTADQVVVEPMGQIGAIFIDTDTLVVQDHTWNRILITDNPF